MDVDAVVLGTVGSDAIVRVSRDQAGCGRCEQPGGCRSGLLSRPLRPDCGEYRVANRIGARVGETVVLRVPEGAVLRAAAGAYVVPVLMILAGAGMGVGAAGSGGGEDVAALAGAATGLALAVALNGYMRRRSGATSRDAPVLVRRGTGSAGC